MCRYVMMEHPLSPRPNVDMRKLSDDPLDLYAQAHPDKYKFYRI